MLPVRLSLKGIYSYREEQIIEFDKLTSSLIFGIFGSVGSGKSTILEAITFALYGEMERIGSTENRNYNILNLKSNEMKIDFEFQVKNEDYRAIVSLKRKKNFSEINTPNRIYYKKQEGEWKAQEDFDVEQTIGLSYKNFRRTVIIPQGKFQEFLQLTHGERTKMLSEVFNLQKYDLFDKVSELTKTNNEHLLVNQTQKAELGNIDTDFLLNAENEITELETKTSTKNKVVTSLRLRFQAFDQLKQDFEKQIVYRNAFNNLVQKHDEISAKTKLLTDFESCQLAFKALFENERLAEKELNAQTIQVQALEKQKNDFQMAFDALLARFSTVEKAFQQRDVFRIEAEDLVRIGTIQQSIITEKNLVARMVAGRQKYDDLFKNQQSEKETKKQLSEQIKHQRADLPDALLISELSIWFSNKKNHLLTIESNKKNVEQLRNQVLAVDKEGEKLVTNFKQNDSLQTFRIKIEGEILTVEALLKQLEVRHQLEQYAHDLHDGEACPLCGSAEHPDVLKSEQVHLDLEAAKAKLSGLKGQIKTIETLQLGLSKLDSKRETLMNSLKESEEKVILAEKACKDFVSTFRFEGFSAEDETAAAVLQDKLKKGKLQIEALEKELETLSNKIETQQVEIGKLEEGFAKADKLVDAEKHTQTLRKQELKQLKFQDYENENVDPILQKATAIQAQIIETEKQFIQLEKQRNELKENLVKTESTLEVSLSAKQNSANKLSSIQQDIVFKITNSEFKNKESIVQILNQNIRVSELKQEIESYNREFAIAKDRLQEKENELEGKTFDEADYSKKRQELSEAESELKALESQKSILISQLEENKLKLARILKLEEELTQLNLRKENLSVLAGLFKASGFVRYVSNIYLQQLCNAANTRFHKLTRQSLQLEVDDKENLNVRDFLNDGQLRSVKTLSGGQTFQASLCLALALADSIKSLSQANQNFFFLDEGFGSLDKESLQVVFETLKALRKENRIVGVISHVEDLQQEIGAYLTIVNDSEKGSLVSRSWEE
jgi:exonuclease SbcC